jgi:3',5'-cyclic AMP phosphodiesterase CpdA
MQIAILSDIHGNLTAFEAVLADLQQTSPDLILHGGDLADAGASPVEIVDRIRDLGWQGVVGDTDEMLFRPESLEEFASQSSSPSSLWTAIRQMAATTHIMLGEDRIAWLRGLERVQIRGPMALVHASPESPWRPPAPEATDAELESVFKTGGRHLRCRRCVRPNPH